MLLFQNGDDWQLEERLDADKKAIVNVVTKENIKTIDYVHRPDAAATEADGDKKDSALLQIYVKQGLTIKTGHMDTTARVDFTDISTGERCKIEIQAGGAFEAPCSNSSTTPTALTLLSERTTVH